MLCAEFADREIALLCNNAGIATFGALVDLDADYERARCASTSPPCTDLTLAVLPQMVKRGSGGILMVGSAAGNMPIPNNATYAASKAFVNTFSESIRGEVAGAGVHVTLLAPGPVRTEEPSPEDASIVDKMVPGFPLGRQRGRRPPQPGRVGAQQDARCPGRTVEGDVGGRRLHAPRHRRSDRRRLLQEARWLTATDDVRSRTATG